MKRIFIILILFSVKLKAQDSLFTYSKILIVDSVSKDDIYNKALIWCGKAFNDSKDAIKVQEREGGIISGKAYIGLEYKYPGKKDSIRGTLYNDYYSDWLIQIKDSKLKFSITDVTINNLFYGGFVTTADIAPGKSPILSQKRNNAEWKYSKIYFENLLNELMTSLEYELKSNIDF